MKIKSCIIWIVFSLICGFSVYAQNKKVGPYSAGFVATDPVVFYDEGSNFLLIKQSTYSNFEFEGEKHLLDTGIDYEYCDYRNKEGFKYKYFLYTVYNLNTKERYEYVLKKEYEDQGYEKQRMYTIKEDENVMFNCRENENESIFYGHYFKDLEIGLSKYENHYYEYLVNSDCTIVYKKEFARDQDIQFTYIGEDNLLIKINSKSLKLYMD
jgi:hypothetical protein